MIVARYDAKQFAQKLNHCLDETGAPHNTRERAAILSKMLGIPKPQAWSFVEGQQLPDLATIELIAQEFEVDLQWLSGISKNHKE
jgi:hypothetical protein